MVRLIRRPVVPDFGEWGLNDCGRWAGSVRAGWDTNRTRMDLLPNAFFIGPENEKTLHIVDI